MKKLLILAAAMVASVSGFAFAPDQTKPTVDDEVHQRTAKGETLDMMAVAGKSGGVKAETLACSLVEAGNDAAYVVRAMMRAGFDARLVVHGAICKGANLDALVAVAVGLGADRAALLASTAAGGGATAGSAAGGIGENGSGFNGANFGQSRAATVGGGGRGSVSKS